MSESLDDGTTSSRRPAVGGGGSAAGPRAAAPASRPDEGANNTIAQKAGEFPVDITLLVNNQATEGLLAEHGLAVWIESAGRRLLFDTGQGSALGSNAETLGVDLRTTDTLVLSHGHYDHTGGVPRVVEQAPSVQVYAHPSATTQRYSIRKGSTKSIAMPGPTRLALEGLSSERVHWLTEPLELMHGLGIASHIPRFTEYEDAGGPFFTDDAGAHPDPIDDDLALWIATNRGLVVVVGCSHAGLINTLQHALRSSGEPKLHAVLGGFHLAEASEARLDRTMSALAAFAPDIIVPCHCTGDAAVERLRRTFGERSVPGTAGKIYRFGVARDLCTSDITLDSSELRCDR